MAALKSQQPGDDATRERIAHDDAVARKLFSNSRLSDTNSALDSALAAAFEELGEEDEAEKARDAQEHDLLESNHDKQQALALLLDETMLMHMSQPPDDPSWLMARLPVVRDAATALFTVAREATHNSAAANWPVGAAYSQFMDLSSQPVASREAVVAVLRALQSYLQLVKQIAGNDGAVREAWIQNAGIIASNL